MKTVSLDLYQFNELSDDAKEKAREWFRQGALDDEWWDSTFDDAKNIGLNLTGFDLDRNRHADGKFINDPHEVADAIIKEHGDTCETFKTAEQFLKECDELVDTWPKDEDGEQINVGDLDDALDSLDSEFLKSLLEDYSIMLQHECEYRLSDECVDEDISANEYTFTIDGKRHN